MNKIRAIAATLTEQFFKRLSLQKQISNEKRRKTTRLLPILAVLIADCHNVLSYATLYIGQTNSHEHPEGLTRGL